MILGLSGKKQAGKSIVAKQLVEKHGFTEIIYAEPLKELIGKQLLGLTHGQLYGDAEKDLKDPLWKRTPRQLIQLIGTECFRAIVDADFWVKIAFKKIDKLHKQGVKDFVITDCRFPNEIEAVEYFEHGHTVRIIRNNYGFPNFDFHPSEIALDHWKFDYTIIAESGDIAGLQLRIDQIVEILRRADLRERGKNNAI